VPGFKLRVKSVSEPIDRAIALPYCHAMQLRRGCVPVPA
jgi:hypothetical protein